MYLRLAFAVAAHLEPTILVVDEVLAVGDAEFQQQVPRGRCPSWAARADGRVRQPRPRCRSPSCARRTIWLEGGRVAADGPTGEVIEAYQRSGMTQRLRAEFTGEGTGPVAVLGVEITDPEGGRLDTPRRDQAFAVVVEFEVHEPLSRLDLSLALINRRGVQVLDESFSDTGNLCIAGRPGVHRARLLIPPVLANDDYSLKLWMGALDDYVELEPFSFRLWPHPEDSGDWTTRVRVVQPEVRWSVDS